LKNPKIRFKFKQDVTNSINDDDDLGTFTSKIKKLNLNTSTAKRNLINHGSPTASIA